MVFKRDYILLRETPSAKCSEIHVLAVTLSSETAKVCSHKKRWKRSSNSCLPNGTMSKPPSTWRSALVRKDPTSSASPLKQTPSGLLPRCAKRSGKQCDGQKPSSKEKGETVLTITLPLRTTMSSLITLTRP